MTDLQILTVKDVCQLLNVSIATIYRWEQEGRLPFKKIRVGPNKVGFRKVDVQAYINDQILEVEPE